MTKSKLSQIEKIISDQMDAANASCCSSLLKIWDKIQRLDWSEEDHNVKKINIILPTPDQQEIK